MYRHAAFLVRQAGMTHEAFVEHWQHEHTPIAREIEGVVRYLTTTPLDPEGAAFDGIADLYFDDLDALRASTGRETDSYDSDHPDQVAVRRDATEFLDLDALRQFAGETTVQKDRPDSE